MTNEFALKLMKKLVAEGKFTLVNRRAPHARAVSFSAAKIIVEQLTINDFVKKSEDRAYPGEYLWIYKTDVGIVYYIKCKFVSNFGWVKFISFHESSY